jgi:DNA-binding CsgD family transcriptional regulator
MSNTKRGRAFSRRATTSSDVASALRLRRRLRTIPADPHEPVAWAPPAALLSAEAIVLHSEGDATLPDARRALQAAACRIERARASSLPSDPGQALKLWKGLVSARWTLVDEFDAHGAKYVVAREIGPRSTGLSILTPTERCVVAYAARGFSTKEIAYTLGFSDTTVRVLIMRAVRRCGARNRSDLLRLTRVEGVEAE